MAKTYNVGEAKTNLSKLLEEVQAGIDVIVARDGEPVARLVRIEPPRTRPMGFVRGRVTQAFFEPLPEDELGGS